MATESMFALISFVLVNTFTPGPNNISSASMGMLYGYQKTVKYLVGISTGFFLVMLICGLVSASLKGNLPALAGVLRWVGAVYILWLAWKTCRATYNFQTQEQPVFGFAQGMFLQLLNPKGLMYGMTLYATFLAFAGQGVMSLVVSAIVLAVVAFAAVSSWALFGQVIRRYIQLPKVRMGFNVGLALLLVYSAGQVLGVI